MFDNIADAKMRVYGSVVRYKGMPVYISNVFENDEHTLYASFYNLITEEERKKVFLKSRYFDFTAFPLGYVNSDEIGAIYLERKAVRKFKAGLNTQNIKVRENESPQDLLFSKDLGKTILNEYPNVIKAFSKVVKKEGAHKVAFSREYAFYFSDLNIIYLEYKGVHVGWVKEIQEQTPYICLGIKFKHMKEELTHKGACIL